MTTAANTNSNASDSTPSPARRSWDITFDGTTLSVKVGRKSLETQDTTKIRAQLEAAGFSKASRIRTAQVARRVVRTFRAKAAQADPRNQVSSVQIKGLSNAGRTTLAFLLSDEDLFARATAGELTVAEVEAVGVAAETAKADAPYNVRRSLDAIIRRLAS